MLISLYNEAVDDDNSVYNDSNDVNDDNGDNYDNMITIMIITVIYMMDISITSDVTVT